MEGINYIVDQNGNKKAILLDYKIFGPIWEDIQDIIIAIERENEDTISFDDLQTELINSGKLESTFNL